MGTAITIKLVDRRYFLKNFTALGLTPPDQLFLVRALDEPSGLVLVTSPPYNGAITTCYSLMDHLAKSERRVVSLEPSIQWQVPYVHQIEISKEKGLDYPSALRSVAGVKPDVVFLLDLGDKETANMACQLSSSLLVIATFPAFSAAESVWRFYELGVPLSLFGRNLSLVLNQRLVRRICTLCREGGDPADPQKLAPHGITQEEARALKLYQGAGCSACNKIGYRRRKGVFEVMTVDRELREILSRSSSLEEIEQASVHGGMETLRERCLRDVSEGVTAIEEFIRWRL
jgi:type II secretory ATPase GspE/PulE/Tfp pilus assembly ATPase PilB-like protein